MRVRLWHDCQRQPLSGGRVRERCQQQVGTLLATSPDSLGVTVLGSKAGPGTLLLAADRVSRIDVSGGEVPWGRGKGLLLGFLGGAAIGFSVGAVDAANCRADARMRGGEGDLCGFTSLITIPLGAVAGSLVGLAIGANRKVERWTTVMTK